MKIYKAVFAGSSTTYAQCAHMSKPAFALMGRSNVGKSSLINMLLVHKQLAKTSSKPGKTRLINHFLVNDAWYLVDLPGYGWAQAGKVQRQQWAKMIKAYLLHSQQLHAVIVLVDARQQPQPLDIILINWLGEHRIPFFILLTKADKPSKQLLRENLARLRHVLRDHWQILPDILVTSSHNKTGREELLAHIQRALPYLQHS